ncbi:transporter substrate-binding domain-containing protein [Ferrimonas balearica]|uniref:transporter substrate-binding domain-containing protein n=1 Tax=Ferrimonas balearica TaxID=44012 RepID=UPI001C992662|nr:transporter substrate-binding domain-containing protein [Ferrimonas balearica]MBY5923381.1 transporter substrate-binding domain-containing protein [Ferrimonas balearica]MBY5995131.1 transporter substrate-binding domain-containing protein [Ferrimonas balearica]
MRSIWFIRRWLLALAALLVPAAAAQDLEQVKEAGVLRHLGVPYAHFVASYDSPEGSRAEGFDVELMQGFARHIGVDYQYIPTTWRTAFGQLTGIGTWLEKGELIMGPPQPIEGDVIANGVTILPWREQLVAFSRPYFPSAVWLVARSDSAMSPIEPSGDRSHDITLVKEEMAGRTVLAMKYSCLDPDLYQLHKTRARLVLPIQERQLNEMVPAIMNRDAESTLLDVADTLIALEKWPGEIKVIGPVSELQEMGVAFRKDSPALREAFNQYLDKILADGTYKALAEKHFPTVYYFFPEFFDNL